jgi:hypothetical protein
MLTTCKQNLGVAPWRQKFSRLNILNCDVHRVIVQPWKIGVCWIDQVFVTELSVVIFVVVHTAVLSIKTAFNLGKIHLVFHIMLLIQWSVIFFVVHVTVSGRLKYIPHLFSEYILTFMVEEPMKICVTD